MTVVQFWPVGLGGAVRRAKKKRGQNWTITIAAKSIAVYLRNLSSCGSSLDCIDFFRDCIGFSSSLLGSSFTLRTKDSNAKCQAWFTHMDITTKRKDVFSLCRYAHCSFYVIMDHYVALLTLAIQNIAILCFLRLRDFAVELCR